MLKINEIIALDKLILPGIYLITNKIDGTSYIGCSINIIDRWFHHANYGDYNSPLNTAINKLGLTNFEFSILELLYNCSQDTLLERENFYIRTYINNDIKLYNRTKFRDITKRISKRNSNSSKPNKMQAKYLKYVKPKPQRNTKRIIPKDIITRRETYPIGYFDKPNRQ